MKVFAIIVTYNAMQWIDRCLSSLQQSTVPVAPIVVDNGSTDTTVSHIRSHYPMAQLIENVENKGFGQANNQGLEMAYRQGATHFFLLNQDAWVHDDTMACLAEVQEKYHYAIVSPVHLNGAGNLLDFGFYEFVTESRSGIQYLSDLIHGRDFVKDSYEIESVNAAAWLISRSTIDEIGGFDPVFFHYGEDDNYLNRLKYHQRKVAIVPSAFIHHDRKQKHGNQQLFAQHQVLNKLRMSFTDINQSEFAITKYRIKVVAAHVLQFFKALFTLHFRDAWRILKDYCLFLAQIPEMLRHNRAGRTLGSHWLNL